MTDKLKKLYLNAGQMKAGTTYLFSILRSHRGIFFSRKRKFTTCLSVMAASVSSATVCGCGRPRR